MLASWAFLGVAEALVWTEPEHGADWALFWVFEGAWLALTAVVVGAGLWDLWWLRRADRDLREQRKALDAYIQSQVAQAVLQANLTRDIVIPASPLDKSLPAEPRAEPIVGYRIWRLDGDKLLPVGMLNAPPWEPGENVAANWYQGPRPTPGFWALRTLDQAREAALEYSDAMVIGVVETYGRVVEHEYGWRAEKARVLAVAGLRALEFYGMRYGSDGSTEALWASLDEAARMIQRGERWLAAYAPDGTDWRYVGDPTDVTTVGRRYGVPVFGSLEGLEAFAREMGAAE